MNHKIFISLASYQDPMLFFTLQQAFTQAARPEALSVAVVDQHSNDQRAAIQALPWARQIRYVHLQPQDTLGVCWARNVSFSLWDGEAYLLQVDSHTCFEAGWDDTLRAQLHQLRERAAKPIISSYPYAFEMHEGMARYTPPEGKTALVLRPRPDAQLTPDDVVLRFHGMHLFTDQAVPGSHLAAGFLFCEGRFVEEVPYDPYLYFHGEEQSLALRAWTRGWDIFHPVWIPLYHLYKQANTAHDTHHWHGAVDGQRAFNWTYLTERAKRRLLQLVTGEGPEGAYGLGAVRTLDQFIEFSGIDYKRRLILDRYDGKLV